MTKSNFNFDKYNEIVQKIDSLSTRLKEKNDKNYTSNEVQEIAYKLMSASNSLNAYIRHAKRVNK
jgi:hypothetical protein